MVYRWRGKRLQGGDWPTIKCKQSLSCSLDIIANLRCYPYTRILSVCMWRGGSVFYLCLITQRVELAVSSEIPQPNFLARLHDLLTQFQCQTETSASLSQLPGPQAEGVSLSLEFHNIFPYGYESTGCILLCLIVHSSISAPIVIGVASDLRSEVLS